MVLDAASLVDVARLWNDQGLRTSEAGNLWTAGKVRGALLSPIVAGVRTHRGEDVGPLMLPDDTPWPAILTAEEREQVRRALRSRFGKGQTAMAYAGAGAPLRSGDLRKVWALPDPSSVPGRQERLHDVPDRWWWKVRGSGHHHAAAG